MKLIRLTANHESFHPVIFHDGLNIIVGKQLFPHSENDGNTYNGVGKSLIVHLIHFCLGSNKIEPFSLELPGWQFTLEFKVGDATYTSTRCTEDQSKVSFCGDVISLTALRQKLLGLCFGLDDPPKCMTWNTLFSRFARRYRGCYVSFNSFTPKEQDYCSLLNNCYLLGINTDLVINKKELRDRQTETTKTAKAIRHDPTFRQYFLGNRDAELDEAELKYQINELQNAMSQFKVSGNYHDLEKDADDISYKKKMLENERALISNNIKNIEYALSESSQVTRENALAIYSAASVEIPDMLKKDVDDVLAFHKSLLLSRNKRLKDELQKQKALLMSTDERIATLGHDLDQLLDYLNTHGALEEYLALTKKLSSLNSELSRIQEYSLLLKSYQDTELDIKEALIKENKQANEYLTSQADLLASLRDTFGHYAKMFYPKKKSGLLLKNNPNENMLRYTLDAHIEDDSSDGINEVRLFCFDLLLLLQKQSNMRFLFHDSRLFANVDPRQRETLFRIADNTCQKGDFQYICSINEDALQSIQPLMKEDEYRCIIEDNVILELNDDSPESKLLGIQVDMDLEALG